jgi:hypothetical protein
MKIDVNVLERSEATFQEASETLHTLFVMINCAREGTSRKQTVNICMPYILYTVLDFIQRQREFLPLHDTSFPHPLSIFFL